jgi:hypothetical protein
MSDLRFKDFLLGQEDTPETTEDNLEPTETPDDSAAEEQIATPVEVRVTLEDRMRAKGLLVPDDMDPMDLYDQAIDRITAGSQAMQEASQLRSELEKLRSAQQPQAIPAAATPVPQETAQEASVSRMFSELTGYDPSIARYVERDEEGQAIPKAAFGSLAVDAARTINDYEEAERRQAQMLLRNPHLLIKDNMSEFERMAEEKANAIIEKRLSAWQEEQQKTRAEQEEAEAAHRQQSSLQEFHDANKGTLFQVGSDGEPLRMPFDQDQFIPTPTGKYFMNRLHELKSEMPNLPHITHLTLAMREAKLAVPPVQKVEPEPVVATQAQQRQKFVEQRNDAAVLPHQNTPAASGSEGVSGAPRLRFADMLRRMPENQDIVSGWK